MILYEVDPVELMMLKEQIKLRIAYNRLIALGISTVPHSEGGQAFVNFLTDDYTGGNTRLSDKMDREGMERFKAMFNANRLGKPKANTV